LNVHTTSDDSTSGVDLTSERRWAGHYDVRRGTGAYAPIFGAFGALAVPGIVLIFQTPLTHANLTTFAAGLLALAVLGSLLGAVTLAAIGAEVRETANLPPAAVRSAVPIVISIVAMFGAFEVLAADHVPTTKLIFTAMAAAGGACGIVFNSFAVGDSWGVGPTDNKEWSAWVTGQWIQSRDAATHKMYWAMNLGWAPVIAFVMRAFGFEIPTTTIEVTVLIYAGLLLIVFGTLLSAIRTVHTKVQKGMEGRDIWGANLAIAAFAVAVVLFLP
jgi:hypothetical protein